MHTAIEEGARTMTTKKTMTRTIRLAIGTTAALVVMTQAAQARPSGINQRTGLPIVASIHHPHRLGTIVQIPVSPANNVAAAHAGDTNPRPFVPTATSTGSFDWYAAAIGAGTVLAVALIGAAVLTARERRRVPLSA
jgi:hypothetical protein